MTTESFDRRLSAWLEDDARGRVADHLSEVLVTTRATRQRPAWSSLERWLPVTALTTTRIATPRPLVPLIVLALIVLTMVAALLIGVGRPTIPPPGTALNGRIAYIDGSSILSVAADGSDRRTIASLPAEPGNLAVSPDGRFVAYSAGEDHIEIAEIGVSGTARPAIRITAPGAAFYGQVAWSPDATQVVFVAGLARDGDHLFVASSDGSGVRELPRDGVEPGFGMVWPAWSPDGQWLAFITADTNRVTAPGRIDLVRPDGTDHRRLDTAGLDRAELASLSWSPDRSLPRLLYVAAGGSVLYYDLASQREVVVASGFWPAWSPTADRISYWNNGTKVVPTPTTDDRPTPIEIFPSLGNCDEHLEMAGTAFCGVATWSPDGTRLIATEVTGNGLLSLLSNGDGDPFLIDVASDFNLGAGGNVAWQPVAP